MQGLGLSTNDTDTKLLVEVDPVFFEGVLSAEALIKFVNTSQYKDFSLDIEAIEKFCSKVNSASSEGNIDEALMATIGELKEPELTVDIYKDKLSASLSIKAYSPSNLPSVEHCIRTLNEFGVKRGISTKRIQRLLLKVSNAQPEKEIVEVVAKGLPPRKGKDSKIKPLVPNAYDRVLKPKVNEDGSVDMREFGEILSVKPNQKVAKRVKPGTGRPGYTVMGNKIKPEPGNWKEIRLGKNTKISSSDQNLILATATGQPKFGEGTMDVDDTFVTKGVNVGTGNVDYDGAVVVNGDVTESMQVIAKGDITINGFVESATIKAGGDIIITEGALGKMHESDCTLQAKGSIFVAHGQGLIINAGKNVNIKKQLAYSKVTSKGTVTVGELENPMGNLFASEISCYSTVSAGTVGAVSGSNLSIDFSEGMNLLTERYESLNAMLKTLRANNFDHEVKLRNLGKKHLPDSLLSTFTKAESMFEAEKTLLQWLENADREMNQAKIDYELNAKVVAYKELFHGITVKLNKQNWRSEREHTRCEVALESGKWNCRSIS